MIKTKQLLYSNSEQGTTVSCLAAFGINLYKDPREYTIEVDAKIFTIKILNDEDGKMNWSCRLKKCY